MIGHGLAKCRVIHDQGRDPEPQQKSSQKIVFDEPDKGRTVAPKQRQEYRKKDPQPKLVEGPTDNSNFVVPGEGNARSPLGHLVRMYGLKQEGGGVNCLKGVFANFLS